VHLLIVMILVVALIVVFHFTPWSKANRLRRLLRQIKAGDETALKELFEAQGYRQTWHWYITSQAPWRDHIRKPVEAVRSDLNQLLQIRESSRQATERAQRVSELTSELESRRAKIAMMLQTPERVLERIEAWFNFLYLARRMLTSDLPKSTLVSVEDLQQVNDLVSAYTQELAEAARSGDQQAFKDLQKFLYQRAERNQALLELGLNANVWPLDWNELVARYVPSPFVRDFNGVPEWPQGLSLVIPEAIRLNNLTMAKMAAALCKERWRGHRQAVGDVLWADLCKFIEAENARQAFQTDEKSVDK
jgi:hypothetical protein